MFLKNFLNNLIFPQSCSFCSLKLNDNKRYCISCQRVLLENFELQEKMIDPFYGKIYPLFFPSKISKNFIYSNPNIAIIGDFFIVRLQRIHKFYPDYIYSEKFFGKSQPKAKKKRCADFQKAVSKRLKKPLKDSKYIQKNNEEKKSVLVIASSMIELNQYKKDLKLLKEDPIVTLNAMVALSPGNFK